MDLDFISKVDIERNLQEGEGGDMEEKALIKNEINITLSHSEDDKQISLNEKSEGWRPPPM